MGKIRLIIENKEVELDESVHFSLNKQFEDLSNPTTIINDWSKTVSIPFSENNNKLFGHIYNPDKVISGDIAEIVTGNPRVVSNTDKQIIWDTANKILTYKDTVYKIQFGLINENWEYIETGSYYNTGGGNYSFKYTPSVKYIEFSFRTEVNEEVAFCQWNLSNLNLEVSKTYNIDFIINKNSEETVISDIILSTEVVPINLNFNPSKKVNFRLEYNNDVIMSGYMKMNSITTNENKGYYNVTLNGELGNILSELKKLGFDEKEVYPYRISGEDYFNKYINGQLVSESFNSTQEDLTLHKISDAGYKWTDIIGFTPSNSYSDLFDYTQYVSSSTGYESDVKATKFVDEINKPDAEGRTFEDKTGYKADSILPNGQLKPRDYGEFRSWLQIPFIYFNKLFQIFKEYGELITGYKFILDENWFNPLNSYWRDYVMTLNTVSDSKDVIESEKNNLFEWLDGYLNTVKNSTIIRPYEGTVDDLPDERLKLTVEIYPNVDIPDKAVVSLSTVSHLLFDAYLSATKTFPFATQQQFTLSRTKGIVSENEMIFPDMEKSKRRGVYTATITIPLDFNFFYRQDWDGIGLSYGSSFISDIQDNRHYFSYYINGQEVPFEVNGAYIKSNVVYGNRSIGSNTRITINDLWDNKYSLYDVIMNYCKKFHILIVQNEFDKTLTFIQSADYFQNYSIEDWSDKVDYYKPITVNPVIPDKKYILFNYSSNECELNKQYKSLYGVNFGEMKVDNGYEFNNEISKIFNQEFPSSMIYTPYVLSYLDLLEAKPKIEYKLYNETFIADYSSENKHISVFGQFYFDNRFKWETSVVSKLPPIYVTDDVWMDKLNKKCYTNKTRNGILQTYAHFLTTVNDGHHTVAHYGYLSNIGDTFKVFDTVFTSTEQKSIYNIIWDDYIVERYMSNNKIIECYIKLSPIDYQRFKFNKFIKIKNQLYLVNKIIDYSLDSKLTKCELISISNIDSYTNTDFQIYYIKASSLSLSLLPTSEDVKTIVLSGNGHVVVDNYNELRALGIMLSINEIDLEGESEKKITINASETTPIGSYNVILKTVSKKSYTLSIKIDVVEE